QARAAGHGPALHYAVELEPQVVVQPACRMLLDDELIALVPARPPARLRGDVELALLAICLQAHGRRPSAPPPELLGPGGNQRQLEVALPIRARRHDATHLPWQTTKNAPGERPVPPSIAEKPRRVKHFAPFPLWPCHPCWLNSSQAGRLPR